MRCVLPLAALMSLAMIGVTVRADGWSPPANPDPHAILNEARADTRVGLYEAALAKHVWFHEHALSIEPAQYGVRLSFALANWRELAEQHPPAMMKLIETRNEAKRNVLAGKDVRESFHDMESINDYLDEQSATMEVFKVLHEKNPKTAKQVFDLAQDSLVQGKAYALIGEFIMPKDDFARMRENYRYDKKLAEDERFGARHLEYANKSFANKATTLVAILAVNDRKKEAEQIAAAASKEWDDASFHAELDKSLEGAVPDPWP